MFFDPRGVPDLEKKLQFMEAQSAWFAKFFGRSLDLGQNWQNARVAPARQGCKLMTQVIRLANDAS
jgi:hypothetical protein